MKEEYLWDKTGQDFEIERMENALATFRYREIAPPALPARIIPFRRETPRRVFRLAFAFAACSAFVIAGLGVWFQSSPAKIEVAKDSTENISPQIERKVSGEVSIKKPVDSIVEKVEMPKQSVKRNIIKIRKTIPAIVRQNILTARNVEIKKPEIKLTKKEKYAYDQLMLALSITGSKLKLVSDKIEGVEEERTIVPENNR